MLLKKTKFLNDWDTYYGIKTNEDDKDFKSSVYHIVSRSNYLPGKPICDRWTSVSNFTQHK